MGAIEVTMVGILILFIVVCALNYVDDMLHEKDGDDDA